MKKIHPHLVMAAVGLVSLSAASARADIRSRAELVSQTLDIYEEKVTGPKPSAFAGVKLDNSVWVEPAAVDDSPQTGRPAPGGWKSRHNRKTVISNELDQWEWSVRLKEGVRTDNLEWTIAGDLTGQSPNILSELIWEDVRSLQWGGELSSVWADRFVFEAEAGWGWIYDGKTIDRDFAGDNRTFEFSRSRSKNKGDYTFSSSWGGGYRFVVRPSELWQDFLTDELGITMLGGYSHDEIRFIMRNLYQDIPATGPFTGEDVVGNYKATVTGPWVGVQFDGQREKFSGFARAEYHWADYFAEADWVLRTDFQHPVSYTHNTDGRGIVFSAGGEYAFSPAWSLGMDFEFKDWKLDRGLDRTFSSNGTQSDQQLNGVKWRSYAFFMTANYQFSLGDWLGGGEPRPQPIFDAEASKTSAD